MAQGQVWIQVESHQNIRETKERAQFFARDFADTHAFQTTSGLYAIVIGPMARGLANDAMLSLKASGQIPFDSFVTDGATHLAQLWPVALNTDTPANTVVISEPETEEAEEVVVLIPDEDLKATRALEKSWTRDQKKEYQTYMVWTGDYTSAIDGAYGPGTRRAIRSYQEGQGYEPTGYLTQTQVDLLKGQYGEFLARLGIDLLRDLDAGIEIKAPIALVEFERFEPPFVHYKARDGKKVRMMLISQQGDRAVLTSLFDIMETFDFVPADGTRTKKRDWFRLTGSDGTVGSFTYARLNKGLIKGFSLVWQPEVDADMRQAAQIMFDSFSPIADYVLDETLGYGQGEDEMVDLTAGIDTETADRQGSGFIISAEGTILTHTSAVKQCKRISLDDQVDFRIVADNPALELAVLQPTSLYTPNSFALFSDEKPEIGNNISVAGFSYPRVMDDASLSFGTLTGLFGPNGAETLLRLNAELQDGDAGGPVLDDRGAILGMQRLQLAESNPLPGYVNFATKAAAIMALLDQHQIAYGRSTAFDEVAPEDLIHMAGDFTVKLSCWN